MNKKDLLAVHAAAKTVWVSFDSLKWGGLWVLNNYLVPHLDQVKDYDAIKAYGRASYDITELMNDVRAVLYYTGEQLDKQIMERVKKGTLSLKAILHIERNDWHVEFVNEMVIDIESMAVACEDLTEMLKDMETGEISQQAAAVAKGAKLLRTFREGVFTDMIRLCDEEFILALVDKIVEVPDPEPTPNEPDELLIDLEQKSAPAGMMLPPPESMIELFETNAEGMTKFRSTFKLHTHKEPEKKAAKRTDSPEIDFFHGVATGIVIPAGSAKRRYLDGDIFPEEIVTSCLYDFMLNSPLVNLDHDENDLTPFWEHPDFRIVEIWQERSGFELNGTWVEKGDWCVTIFAISEEFKEALKNGEYNGFSMEGWLAYAPEHLLAVKE